MSISCKKTNCKKKHERVTHLIKKLINERTTETNKCLQRQDKITAKQAFDIR